LRLSVGGVESGDVGCPRIERRAKLKK
jgi:hypothetical protein